MQLDLNKAAVTFIFDMLGNKVCFFILENASEMDEFLKKANAHPLKSEDGCDGATISCSKSSDLDFIIVLNEEELTINLIVHEMMHACLDIIRKNNLNIFETRNNDETICEEFQLVLASVLDEFKKREICCQPR